MADADLLPFAQWLRDLSATQGCLVESERERIYVATVGSHGAGLFLCLNPTTETAWMCRGDQLGRWFGAADLMRPLRIEPEYAKAWASRL